MKVLIENNLYLESDGREFTIKKYGAPYVNSKGETVEPFTAEGHYTNIQSACKGLLKMKLMESTATELKELLESVESIKKYIEERVAV